MTDGEKLVVKCELSFFPKVLIEKEFDGESSFEIISEKYSFEECTERFMKIRKLKETYFEQKKLKGLCVTCMRRKRCHKALEYLDIKNCSAYKVHKNRGKSRDE